ncbi:hypothetical protein J3R83DRAFT_11293 [Lanmaoa asiatica]|nr:hypothetical protein J3R83DRAFT_11293 [Lanmaoa asiatica]
METLTLNCWVRAQDSRGVFEVEISRTKTVAALQKAIKNEKPAAFHDVDADNLYLYKPRDPVAEPYEENLSNVVLSELGKPLPPLRKLADLFIAAPEEHIHIIVVFGQFLDDCKTHSIIAEDNVFIGKFADAMSEVYGNEKERVDRVNAVLASYKIGLRVTTKKGAQGYHADGDLSVGEYRYVIAEFKNEAAASVSEPYMQAAAYYLERTRIQALENTGSPLPCFLLALFGPYVVFSGAVWNLRPAVQLLSTPLAFNYHSTDIDNQITAARHMAAFRKALRSLKQYYDVLAVNGLPNMLSHPSLFPHPTSYTSLADNSKKTFRYRERVKDDHKLLFFGTSDTETPICIKFVRHYSRDAHRHCAQSGFAPTLRGYEQIPGGWFMVVMDELVGYKSLDDWTDRLPKPAFEEIRNQLNRLHNGDFVHGDVRDVNIMVREGTSMTLQFMIIDFDWAGKINVARYPPYVNRKGIDRPDDAIDGELILAAHDHWMLENIINRKGM